MSQDSFQELFTQFGPVTSAIVQIDADGKSKGFGFVNFENHEDAAKAVEALHDSEQNGKKLFVTRAQKKEEREQELRRAHETAKVEKESKYQGVNLYIKNLEDDVDDDKLRGEFEPFGTVTSCKIMRDDKGVSKGFGFVCYSSPDEATKAVAEMNNKMIGSKPLYVSLAQRREARQRQLESQMAQRNNIRMQQAAAAGMPGGYINGPMYYPPGPGGFPPQAGRGMMPYGQPGIMPPRPRYPPGQGPVAGMPMGGPYGQPPPGYPNMQGFPPRGAVRPPNGRGPSSPEDANVPMQRGNVPPLAVPPMGMAGARPSPAPAAAPPRQAQPPKPQVPVLTAAALAAVSQQEQKQMLGEVIYMNIVG